MAEASAFANVADIPLMVEAVIRGPSLKFSELMGLRLGSFITTQHPAGETIEVVVGDTSLGTGEFTSAKGCAAIRMVAFKGKR